MTESTEITAVEARAPKPALRAGAGVAAIVPRDLDEAWRLVEALHMAGIVPASYDGRDAKETKAKMMIGVMKSMEVGMPPITGLENIAIINKRPTIWGDLAVALVQDAGVLADHEVIWSGPTPTANLNEWPKDFGVTVRYWRKGQKTPYEGRFTVEDADRARLWLNPKKDPWMKSPTRMLFNRARAFALRDGFSDCLKGLAIREEVEDLPVQEPERKASVAFLDDDPTVALPAPETPEEAPEAEVEELAPEATEPAPCEPETSTEGLTPEVTPNTPKETPQENAQRMADRARSKLAECQTAKEINEAYRLYCDGACELLVLAGLNDEADKLASAYADAIAELAA